MSTYTKTKDQDDRDDKPKRVRECPWCGCARAAGQAFDGYCDEHCRKSYKHYMELYQTAPYRRGR